ncbi:MAG TPA: VanZ family protein [Terriglobales bacterium]|nr:VanZ family protein [Terriglobales bacterium]
MFPRFLKAWLPVAAMCVVIFMFSQDAHSGEHSNWLLRSVLAIFGLATPHYLHLLAEPFRKFAHVCVYFLLGALTYRGFAMGRTWFSSPAALRAWIFCTAYAASDEYHQSFIATRGPSVRDAALDSAAAALALLVIWLWRRSRSQGESGVAARAA